MFLVDFLVSGLRMIFIDHWPITLTVVLGLTAIYLLLPQPKRQPILLGGAAAGGAVLAVCFFLVRAGGFTVETVLFYVFAVVALVAGGLLVTQRNPARAALAFALVILAVCGLFLLQAAPFLMAATIIVYAGAIIVTFLFVLMLAQQQSIADADGRSREPFLASATGFVLLGTLLYLLHSTYQTEAANWLDKMQPQVTKLQDINQRIELGQTPPNSEVNEAVKDNYDLISKWREAWEQSQGGADLTEARNRDALGRALDVAYSDLKIAQAKIDKGQEVSDLLALEDVLQTVRQTAQVQSGTLSPLSSRADVEDPVRYWLQGSKDLPRGSERIVPLRLLTQRVSLAVQSVRRYKLQPDAIPDELKMDELALEALLEEFQRSYEEWQKNAKIATPPHEPVITELTEKLAAARLAAAEQTRAAREKKRIDLDLLDKRLEALRAASVKARAELRLRFEPMSALSGPPSSLPASEIRRDAEGRPHLPADNTAYLGRSLFGDYLLAVEMGGMLLLVATIGAIAIANRHKNTPVRPPVLVTANGAPARRHP